jgi:hypothetical protein
MVAVSAWLRSFGAFWWDFVVGDDWRIAVGVVVAFVVTALLAYNGFDAWWLITAAALVMLTVSVTLAARAARRR